MVSVDDREMDPMVVEVVELEQGRSVTDLAADLERHGGALVVLKWQRGTPTLASVFLPDDDLRQATCRRLLAVWRSAPPMPEVHAGGYAWPVGHPRHRVDLGLR